MKLNIEIVKLRYALFKLANSYHTGANASDRARQDVKEILEELDLPYIHEYVIDGLINVYNLEENK